MEGVSQIEDDSNVPAELPLENVVAAMRATAADHSCTPADGSEVVVARAAELFLTSLLAKASEPMLQSGRTILEYSDVAQAVQGMDRLDFLRDVVPHKVKVSDLAAAAKR